MSSSDNRPGLEWDTSLKDELTEPPLFKVLLHNDDYTTMEFVVRILKIVFNKDESRGHEHHAFGPRERLRRMRYLSREK